MLGAIGLGFSKALRRSYEKQSKPPARDSGITEQAPSQWVHVLAQRVCYVITLWAMHVVLLYLDPLSVPKLVCMPKQGECKTTAHISRATTLQRYARMN